MALAIASSDDEDSDTSMTDDSNDDIESQGIMCAFLSCFRAFGAFLSLRRRCTFNAGT